MKPYSLNFRFDFGAPEKERAKNFAYIEPMDDFTQDALFKYFGKRYLRVESDPENLGILALKMIQAFLELYIIRPSTKTHSVLRARKEWDEIQVLIGIKAHLEDLKNIEMHSSKQMANELWKLLKEKKGED